MIKSNHNKYIVGWKRKVEKQLRKCPKHVQEKFSLLVKDLKAKGAIQKEWNNFSELGKDTYHCHLEYNWVAVWHWEKGSIIVEVRYVGSREKAPY